MYKPYYYIINILSVLMMVISFFILIEGASQGNDAMAYTGIVSGFGTFIFLFFVQAINKIIKLLDRKEV